MMWAGAALRPPGPYDGSLPGWLAELAEAEAATQVDLASPEDLLPPATTSEREAPSAPLPPAPFPGDQTTEARDPRAQADDGAPAHGAPAPDHGAGTGRLAELGAWRRDASTLHERVADGAEVDQPSHARRGSVAGSAQAVRREPETGSGDSARTQRAQTAPLAARYAIIDVAADGVGGETREVGPPEVVPATTAALPEGQRTVLMATQGPLDAESGARSYDVDRRAFAPTDDRETRAASTAAHPSITDLTLAAVSGNTREGRGPSDMPGAVSQPTPGVAASLPAVRGSRNGTDDAAATRERVYDRYNQEIRARVNRALVWPRALAIRLEQGETVLRFVVRPDGQLADGIQVVKSSGFIEFDQAALDAVRKASPFPPMSHEGRFGPLAVNLRVPFSNPLVR